MPLSAELISQFVETTKNKTDVKNETIVCGTITKHDGSLYVKIDGSDLLTPYTTTAVVKDGDRVTVMIKNHTATVTGNLKSPSASSDDLEATNGKVNELDGQISEFGEIVAKSVNTEQLNAANGRIDNLVTENILIKDQLIADEAKIQSLEVKNVTIEGKLAVNEADISELKTEKLDAEFANLNYAKVKDLNATDAKINNLGATYATIDRLNADKAEINELVAKKIDVETANATYANIDFSNIGEAAVEKLFSESGIIEDLIVSDGKITGELVGVTIKGDLIEGNTIKADKLVVKGSDGLYYKLNVEAGAVESTEVTKEELQNGLHGTTIIAKTITAEKIAVDDLVAFDATIGGFNITNKSLYSGVKSSIDNTTKGIYLDSEGQVCFGDGTNYFKYYKDSNGNYKLAIAAESFIFSGTNKSVETVVDELQEKNDSLQEHLDNLKIGGRNVVPTSVIAEARNVKSTGEFELRDVWDSPFIYNAQLVNILEPATEYTIKYDLELIERTDVPTKFDMMCGFFIYSSTDSSRNISLFTSMKETAEIGESTTYMRTFTTPSTWADENVICYSRRWTTNGSEPIGHDVFRVTNFKIEKGNKATDWTPAPEDVVGDIDDAVKPLSEAVSEISQHNTDMNDTINQMNDDINNALNTVTDDIASIKSEVSAKITAEDVTVAIRKEIEENGTSKVTTTMGTFDDNGLTIDRTDASTKTQITENGMTVYKKGETEEAVLTANSDGVDAENLHATTYLIVGANSRFEDYGSGRTGCFWIGG